MKPNLKLVTSFAFLIVLLVSTLTTKGTSISDIHLDGYAHLRFRFCRQELVGYTTEVTSNIPPCLVVYNLKTSNIAWQHKIDSIYTDLQVMPDGTLLLVDNHFLRQLNIQDGKTLRTIDLELLSWPITERPKHPYILGYEKAEESLRSQEMTKDVKDELLKLRAKKNELMIWLAWDTQFTLERITPSLFFVKRRSRQGFGTSAVESSDWVIYNATNNTVVKSGIGAELVGRGAPDEAILYGFLQEYDRLFTFRNGASLDIDKMLSTGHPGWKLGTESKSWTSGHSHDGRCLISYEQFIANDNTVDETDKEQDVFSFSGNIISQKDDSKDHYALYDSRTQQLTYLDLDRVKGHCTRLVLHNTNLVRYSYCASSETNPVPFFIESLDFTGKSIAKLTIPSTSQNRRLWFCGRSTQGELIFVDSSSVGNRLEEETYSQAKRIFVIEAPSLKIKAQYQIPAAHGSLNYDKDDNADKIIQVEGHVDIQHMKNDTQPHQFIVRCLDLYSGNELWSFKRDVIIQKQKSP